MQYFSRKTIAVIVAHPDDETLWVGGTILNHPFCNWYVVCLSRASDSDRSPKFYKTLETLHAKGIMGDLDDGPNQTPINENELQQCILDLLPKKHFDIIFTHNPNGEYTRHLRHEEVSKAVISLWHLGKIKTSELRTFAYEDGEKAYVPVAIEDASLFSILTKNIWEKKRFLMEKIYGYSNTSWEVLTTPRIEAFWQFSNSLDAIKWLHGNGVIKAKDNRQFENIRKQYRKIVSKICIDKMDSIKKAINTKANNGSL